MTLWGNAAWASGSGTACSHFEQCPKSYMVLFSLLGPYLLWLAWNTVSGFCKNRDYLRDPQKTKQSKPRKSKKKQAGNQNELPSPRSGDASVAPVDGHKDARNEDYAGWLLLELLVLIILMSILFH
ncbi:hypothetical protein DBV14_27360 [Variovorax sp. KBW07]|nr:hypothetical protein DBV14_27360 [Variovorax sp. KBW07]